MTTKVQPKKLSRNSGKPLVSRSGLIATWDGEEFKLSKDFVDAVKALLIAEIKLMRQVHSDSADCWYCGAAEIGDMASSNYLVMTFGGRDEVDYMSKAEIFVTVD